MPSLLIPPHISTDMGPIHSPLTGLFCPGHAVRATNVDQPLPIKVTLASELTLAVTSREVVWLFPEQFGPEFVPVFHRL